MSSEKTRFTCPDCGGAIEKITEDGMLQYRCRIGHLYSPESALLVHAEREENTLWTSVVLLEEGAELAEEIAALDSYGDPQALLQSAKAKRELVRHVREAAMKFPKIARNHSEE